MPLSERSTILAQTLDYQVFADLGLRQTTWVDPWERPCSTNVMPKRHKVSQGCTSVALCYLVFTEPHKSIQSDFARFCKGLK